MGKTILTPAQHNVLELAAQDQGITDWFYFTGGTALAEFYLHHRFSEDLDFFSEDQIHHAIIDDFIEKVNKKMGTNSDKKSIQGHGIFTLTLPDKSLLKIDFVYQPFKQLEFGKRYKKLRIAGLWDITIDKIYTIFNRGKARDFVDLYFCIKELDCDVNQLLAGMEEKYRSGFDRMSLLSRLPIVKDLVDYPKMIVPFDKDKMEDFFFDLVKSQENKIFK
jgi:predicted nucleotidyltransferase component of viral defense system